jgi:GntR family transcriptional regulator, transcriptional repressor for pyruvate dehydrogenase complex
MPLQAVEPRRLYRQIADQLRSLIRQGEYAVGARLPAERDLALQLAVSRPSVREALIALEVEGLVEIRPGSGIHVVAREPMPNAARLAPNAFGPFEIMQARQWVEGELAAQAATRATAEQVAGLREAIAVMEEDAAHGRMPIRGDRLFHLRLAQAAGNAPLLRVVTELFDERNNPLFEQMGQHFENAQSWRKAIAEHRAVVAAVAARRVEPARLAMQRHLERSQQRFAQAWPQAQDRPRRPAQRPTAKAA